METGFINIDKPKGITSFGVIHQLRKVTGLKKIGHAGTLDPMATGVLLCAIGRDATKRIDEIQAQEKEYEAEIQFGFVSDTYDAEGQVTEIHGVKLVSKKEIITVINEFTGHIQQTPPAFSAKKVNGKRAYDLAREGEEFELEPVDVYVKHIQIEKYQWPMLRLTIKCGKGTYIRSLAHDIGEALGVGGMLTYLRRTKIGDYSIKDSVKLDALTEDNWKSHLFQLEEKS